ncbi:hypothetical protein JCM24511_04798 [Saitozyma sp. JCM 24511]|nr:hypothetical protein JCM24511_04798 [Saitozyma sp. JCM 24511]
MSLYADEDIALAPSGAPEVDLLPPSRQAAHIPTDPLQALAAALTCPAESPAQAEALIAAGTRFEEHPDKLPELCAQLLPMVVDGGESLLRSWTLDMVSLAVGRSSLRGEIKLAVAQSSLDALNRLLGSTSVTTIRAVIPIFSTIHPILFRLLATSRPPQPIYDAYMSSKARILAFALDPNAQPRSAGIRAAAWKFVQKVLIAGTRAAAADPRLQKQAPSEPSVAMITRDSPLSVQDLEEEANLLRTQLVTQMYSIDDPAILHPIINTVPLLCKARPTLTPLLVGSLTSWTPAALEASGRQPMHIRSVEKTLRMVINHLTRHPPLAAFIAQLNEALVRQKQRMEVAFVAEQTARKARKAAVPAQAQVLGKHPWEAESSAQAAKRARYEVQAGTMEGRGVLFDVSTIPIEAVIDVVMEGLRVVSSEDLQRAFENARRALFEGRPDAAHVLALALGTGPGVKEEEEEEVLNPLEMEMDDEELMPEREEEVAEEAITFAELELPPPEPLNPGDKEVVVRELLERIWISGADLAGLPEVPKDGIKLAVQPKEMWMLLLARMSTRSPEARRKALSSFIAEDFAARSKFASLWLNEEWFNDKRNGSAHFQPNLDAVLRAYLPKLDAKDKSLSAFVATLPEVPPSVIDMLETLCEESERSIVGFLALRDLIDARPPVRAQALGVLLQLCTFPDRKIRVLAISSVRRWVPGSSMSPTIINYALGVLRRLVKQSPSPVEGEDTEMAEDKKEATETGTGVGEVVDSKFLGEVNKDTVQQHVELAFALSRRQQDLLHDIFQLYPKMEPEIQDAVDDLFEPLIQSLGPTEKLLSILREFPQGAEKLALRVVTVLSAGGASPVLLGLLKGLMAERDLDPRFIIPIIGELDKGEIEKQIPRIVSLLGTGEGRDVVRTAFASVLQKMTPADLLVALHAEETGRKATIEAIGICFSMTTVFRSDVLATVMSRIADLPSLPVVFLRTIIQAVTTYKSLVPFVANNVLPKLVAKKIWTTPQLWDGFVRLAKLIAPASFGVLLQLPKEWLRDVVDRQPALKAGLKGFLASKPQAKSALVEVGVA